MLIYRCQNNSHYSHNVRYQVLLDCERKHNTKDSNYETLARAIAERVRDEVGETHWMNARRIQKQMIIIRQKKKLGALHQSKQHSQDWIADEAIEAAETISSVSQGSQSPSLDWNSSDSGSSTCAKTTSRSSSCCTSNTSSDNQRPIKKRPTEKKQRWEERMLLAFENVNNSDCTTQEDTISRSDCKARNRYSSSNSSSSSSSSNEEMEVAEIMSTMSKGSLCLSSDSAHSKLRLAGANTSSTSMLVVAMNIWNRNRKSPTTSDGSTSSFHRKLGSTVEFSSEQSLKNRKNGDTAVSNKKNEGWGNDISITQPQGNMFLNYLLSSRVPDGKPTTTADGRHFCRPTDLLRSHHLQGSC